MAPAVFEDGQYEYIQDHLRILSGFYGVVKPLDGVVPYRLEMKAKAAVAGHKNLYDFWGSSLYTEVMGCRARTASAGSSRTAHEIDSHILINLASKEYSVCISRFLPPGTKYITCVFGEKKDGKIIEKGTLCKMARGEMVRYLAEHAITDPQQIKTFDRMHYQYNEEYTTDTEFIFIHNNG
jgi:cytoplasmic iron level regulating protein YaaA (DUF328/UPF0246 family)